MRTDEHDRHELFRALEQRIDVRLLVLEHRLVAEFRAQIIAQSRLLFCSMIGAVFTAASLAFAAGRF